MSVPGAPTFTIGGDHAPVIAGGVADEGPTGDTTEIVAAATIDVVVPMTATGAAVAEDEDYPAGTAGRAATLGLAVGVGLVGIA